MADRTQEERDAVDAKRRASQERARARKAEKKAAKAKTEAKASAKPKAKSEDKPVKPKARPARKTGSDAPRPKARPESKPEGKPEGKKTSARPMSDADEVKRRTKPRIGSENRMSAIDAIPLAAAAGAARRGGARRPTGTGRPMIGQRPIPFDSGVSRSTEIIPSRTPRGGNMYMLNPGGGPSRLGGPMEEARRPRLMAKGGLVKTNCGASMKPDGKRKK